MPQKPNDTRETYNRLRIFASVVLLLLFAFVVVMNVCDDVFFGNRIEGGIDPLFFGLIGSLLTMLFVSGLGAKK